MTGYDYEYAVASYLRKNGFYGVKVTQASGDYGVDVIARKGLKKYAVQCKYYSKPVGVAAVQEVAAGKSMYHCNAAMVVTNNRFTAAAETLARSNGVVLVPLVSAKGIGPQTVSSSLFGGNKVLWMFHLVLSIFLLKVWFDLCQTYPTTTNRLFILFVLAVIAYPVWFPRLWHGFWDILLNRKKSPKHKTKKKK